MDVHPVHAFSIIVWCVSWFFFFRNAKVSQTGSTTHGSTGLTAETMECWRLWRTTRHEMTPSCESRFTPLCLRVIATDAASTTFSLEAEIVHFQLLLSLTSTTMTTEITGSLLQLNWADSVNPQLVQYLHQETFKFPSTSNWLVAAIVAMHKLES